MTGAWILLAAVALAVAGGLWHRSVRGRFDRRAAAPEPAVDAEVWASLGAAPGERATLLQFSSAFCAPCRATRVTLADVAGIVPGVAHVEVDAEQHLGLVRRLGVLRTPTTLVLDADGVEATRAAGAPSREQVLAALSRTSPSRMSDGPST